MSLPLIKADVMHRAWTDRKAFRVRLEFRGVTDKGNSSAKWWEAEYDPEKSGGVVINYGRIGSAGLSDPKEYSISSAVDRTFEKVDKGYTYAEGTLGLRSKSKRPDTLIPVKREAPAANPRTAALPPPFQSVTKVERVFEGNAFLWEARDASGALVSKLSDSGGRKLIALLSGGAA